MINKQTFFDEIRKSLFNNRLTVEQVDSIEAVLDAGAMLPAKQLAYVLATTYHETAGTMRPIAEYGKGKTRKYGKRVKSNGTPYTDTTNIFYGRGFVQITWYDNYEKLGKLIKKDLINVPDLCLTNDVAAKIAIVGMTLGLFTGKKLSDYFNDKVEDPIQARRIINGVRKGEKLPDKAELIASYYKKFLEALT